MNDFDRTDKLSKLKNELMELPLPVVEKLFNEIITKKKKEEREQQKKAIYYEKLLFLLTNLCDDAEKYKSKLSLFEMIGCDFDGYNLDEIYQQMTIGKLQNFRGNADYKLQPKLQGVSSQIDNEIAEWYTRYGAVVYQSNYQTGISEIMSLYFNELEYFCRKFGDKAISPQYLKVLINTMRTKKILPYSKNDDEIIADMKIILGI